jgi:hypothetical protein
VQGAGHLVARPAHHHLLFDHPKPAHDPTPHEAGQAVEHHGRRQRHELLAGVRVAAVGQCSEEPARAQARAGRHAPPRPERCRGGQHGDERQRAGEVLRTAEHVPVGVHEAVGDEQRERERELGQDRWRLDQCTGLAAQDRRQRRSQTERREQQNPRQRRVLQVVTLEHSDQRGPHPRPPASNRDRLHHRALGG